MKDNLLAAFILGAAVLVAGFGSPAPVVNVALPDSPSLGRSAGPDHTSQENFLASIVIGPEGGGATLNSTTEEENCVSVVTKTPTLAGTAATGTVQIALTGVETSTTQVYSVTITTSTAGWGLVRTSATVTSTAGNLEVLLRNTGGNLVGDKVVLNACYKQF